MFKSQKVSLSAAPFYASLLVILALAVFIGIFWAINEYQAHQESIENISKNYEDQYRVRVVPGVTAAVVGGREQTTIRLCDFPVWHPFQFFAMTICTILVIQ